ncbi:hypothetical protein [Bacillus sp. FJAT-47783]|uniref:hypothetical protein n=1 Tax=Bacillus sp. FJAT-47783 TaxID=2922712 RepID=UPI001FABF007|nr:hypothetical protein [Bacillus sp. FJAT-47783]
MKTIQTVLDEFLAEQRVRLKDRTYSGYESVIELFIHYLNDYAYMKTDVDEQEYVEMYNEGKMFAKTLSIEKLTTSMIEEFLDYFMIRKVMASESFLKTAGTVMKKLVKWLGENHYTSKEENKAQLDSVNEIKKDLPLAERVSRLLYEHSMGHAEQFEEYEEDYYVVEKVEKGILWAENSLDPDSLKPIVVPEEVSTICKEGWEMFLVIGLKNGKWYVLESGNVYP